MRILFVFVIYLLFTTTLFAQKVNYPIYILQSNGEIYNKNKKLSKNDILNSIDFIRFNTTHDVLVVTDQKQGLLCICPKDYNYPDKLLNCDSPGVDCTPKLKESTVKARQYNYTPEEPSFAQYVINTSPDSLLSPASPSSNNYTLIYKYGVIKNHTSQNSIKLIFPHNPK